MAPDAHTAVASAIDLPAVSAVSDLDFEFVSHDLDHLCAVLVAFYHCPLINLRAVPALSDLDFKLVSHDLNHLSALHGSLPTEMLGTSHC